jgi:hypothetical protein
MLDLKLTFDVSEIQGVLKELSMGQLPRTTAAVRDATMLIQRTWIQAANGREVSYQGRTFSVKRVSGDYARSIEQGLQYPDGGDELAGRVTANATYAEAIEQGSPPRDMKPGLLAGPKARRAKDGSVYTIVPFRHGTPGSITLPAMPKEIYQQAKRFAHSRITGSRMEQNAHGVPVRRNTYKWGDRLGQTEQGWRSRIKPEGHEYTHTTSIFSGMVRMGSPKHSTFMTFRVVSSKSPSNSWWSPGSDPKPVAAAVAEMVEPHVMAMIRTAFTEDLASAIGDE